MSVGEKLEQKEKSRKMKTRAQAKLDLMEVDEPSYDILEWFPILYCQEVFKYLDRKDMIQASGVNKEWRKFAGEKQQMTKVKLVFDEKNSQALDPKSVEMIKKSKQKYQNIEFRNISDRFAKYIPEVLANRAGSWKSVKMWGCQIYEKEVWTAIFAIVEPSIEELSFEWMAFSELPVITDLSLKWTFPRLKDLEGDNASVRLCQVFVRCTSLVSFNWYSFKRPIGVILTLVRNNHNLQNLTATTHDFLLENSVDFKFKLKKLHLLQLNPALLDLDILHSFLETQAQTLESLQLHTSLLGSLNRDCLDLILNMPRLTSFTTRYSDMEEAILDEALPLPENNSITYLELQSCVYMYRPLFETLFRALTSLQHFKCDRIQDQMFFALAREVPALESFEAYIFDVSRFPEGDIFPDIKTFKVEVFRQGLQEPTGDGNFASLAREEMRKWR